MSFRTCRCRESSTEKDELKLKVIVTYWVLPGSDYELSSTSGKGIGNAEELAELLEDLGPVEPLVGSEEICLEEVYV
jgi:hypothetical protein